MKKDGHKLPVKSQMEEQEKPAKQVMKAIGQSILKPQTPGKKKKPKIPAGPSSQNVGKKQNRVDKPDMSVDADEQE